MTETPQNAFFIPTQQTRVSTTRHAKAKGGCCFRAASWRTCAKAADRSVTRKYTHRYQPRRNPWAFQKRAVIRSGPCQSSTSASQQVPSSARYDWLPHVPTDMHSGKAQLPRHLDHCVLMPDLLNEVCGIAAAYGTKIHPPWCCGFQQLNAREAASCRGYRSLCKR